MVVYADIDGSLLNSNYKADTIEPILQQLIDLDVAIVFNSSKTQAEIEHYRKKWCIKDPYIVENGSAIIIPKKYFHQNLKVTTQTQNNQIIELGTPYKVIREKLRTAKAQTGVEVRGFGDMTTEELAQDSGLPIDLAKLSKKRMYSEPFKVLNGNVEELLRALTQMGLFVTKGGRYLHAMGNTDKGKAAQKLKQIYTAEYTKVFCVGVGDSANDLPLLKAVDKPFWVDQKTQREKVWAEILSLAQTHYKKI